MNVSEQSMIINYTGFLRNIGIARWTLDEVSVSIYNTYILWH